MKPDAKDALVELAKENGILADHVAEVDFYHVHPSAWPLSDADLAGNHQYFQALGFKKKDSFLFTINAVVEFPDKKQGLFRCLSSDK